MTMQEPDYLENLSPKSKTYALSLYESGNEVFFFWEKRLLFHFKASLQIESREINNLLQSKAILDLLDMRETRHLGWEVISSVTHGSTLRDGYTLYTKVETGVDHGNVIPPGLAGIWNPGHALADHRNSRIYISRFNRPALLEAGG